MNSANTQNLIVKHLGLAPYAPTYDAMRAHNRARTDVAPDEIWLLEHPPVFTLGLAGKSEHVLAPGDIPVIKVDRGGQVTYHGPGQLVAYLLLNLSNKPYGVKALVNRIEQSVIDLLAEYRIESFGQTGMPGVYVKQGKIAAIGLRVARHGTYHGLSLNVDMDLQPFTRINPCGYEKLKVVQMRDFGVRDSVGAVGKRLVLQLQKNFD